MASVVFLLVLCGVASAADVRLRHVDVFQSGTQGYHTFRIPAIALTGNGTLLALAEGRVNNASDPGSGNPIDTVYKRSTDGGQTWSALEVLAPGGVEIAAFQPTTVVDRTDGMNRVWVFYNYRNPNPPPGRENDKGLFARYSDDNGLTWSTPQSYEHLRPAGATNFTANIASGVQMASGRLVIPMKTDFSGTESQPSVLYSDDHGTTWALGGLTPPGTNEHQIVELADGSLLSNQRPNSGTVRRISISINGGLSWSTNVNGPNLTPVSTGIERYTLVGVNAENTNRILFTAPTGGGVGGNRSQFSVFTSFDEGLTYVDPKLLYHGPSAYSDIASNNGDTFGTLWERGDTSNYKYITFSVANRAVLTPSGDTSQLAFDGFDYATGSLGRNIGGNGFNSTWLRDADLTDAADVDVVGGSLQYQNLSFSPVGNHVQVVGGSLSRGLGVPIDLDVEASYYVSMLLTQSVDTSANGGSGEFLDVHFLDSSASSHFDFGVSSSEQFRIRGLGTTQTTPAGSVDRNETYFLVARIISQNGSNGANFDQAFLKVYESGDSIPATDDTVAWTLVGTTNENDDAVLDRLRISGGANATWSLDELHVGMDFASVVLGPPPLGDLNGDRLINISDWLVFRGNMNRDTSSVFFPDRPTLGDFDQSGRIGPGDFTEFVAIYDAANGAGAFQSLLSVPEPATSVLMLAELTWLVGLRYRNGIPAARRQ